MQIPLMTYSSYCNVLFTLYKVYYPCNTIFLYHNKSRFKKYEHKIYIPAHSGKTERYLLPPHHRANCQGMLCTVALLEAGTNQLHQLLQLLEQSVEQSVEPLAPVCKDPPMLDFLK